MSLLRIPESEVEFSAVRAQGPGGQNVNKLATAVVLRWNVRNSSLPEAIKTRWLQAGGHGLTADGVLILKAQRFRTQEANRRDAWTRLYALLARYAQAPKPRQPTRPTRASVQRRLQAKAVNARRKAFRQGRD